ETAYVVERSPNGTDSWTGRGGALPAGTTSFRDTGLTASTSYWYRVRATNGVGPSAWSNVATATTQAPAPTAPAAPSGLVATAPSATAVDLSWVDNASDETAYAVERSLNGTDGWTSAASLAAGTTTFRDTGLTASTSYSYRVRATNAVGPSTWSNVATATTQAPTPTLPATPSGLTATAASSAAVDLSWVDNASDETAYVVERSPDGTGSWTVLAGSLPAGSTSYSDTGLSASTAYSYRVKATNVAGSSTYSNVATTTTPAPPPTVPSAPSGLTATAPSASAIDLSWVDNATDETAYVVERSPNGTDSWTVLAGTLPSGTTSYADGGLDASTSYSYRVRATNVAGSSAYSNVATATTRAPAPTAPATPTGLVATAVSPTSISLTWVDNATDETAYVVERSPNGLASWTVVAGGLQPGTTSFQDLGLNPSTAYSYRVVAQNGAGSSIPSNVATATTQAPAPTVPAAPSGLAATASSSTSIDLSWVDNATDETAYVVERSLNGADSWTVRAGALPAGSTSYSDSGLSASTGYFYRVKATNAAGSSTYSSTATATTQAAPPLFAETFTGATGSVWDATRWSTDTAGTGTADLVGGEGRVRFENVSGARVQMVAKTTPVLDSDMLASFRYDSVTARGYLYFFARGSGNWVGGYPGSSYFVQLINNDGAAQIWKSVNGVTTSLANVSGVSAVTTSKQWVRLQVQGSSIRVKVWTDGTPEPSAWEVSVTDTTITTAGVPQLKWLRSSSSTAAREVFIDDLVVTKP
ncbi:MAG: fibronectin type III domain-containing protein, partial [Terracoccus sp.]